MNGAEESPVAFMSRLFTPTVLFCIMNLVIGTIFITSQLKKKENHHHNHQQSGEGDNLVNSPPHLARVPSFLDRVKSFNFSSYHPEQPDPFHSATRRAGPDEDQEQKVEEEVVLESDQQMVRSKSETSVKAAAKGGGPARMMKKSLSEKGVVVEEVDRRLPATVREREGRGNETVSFVEDESVDEKADDFINRFRQQLKLQRLDSILRYKEMLNRGVGR